MPHYSEAAEYYDLLYQNEKDYTAEADLLTQLIRERAPTAVTLLDVGCGTGSHARALIDAGFTVDGVDIEPAFVELARAKCPEGTFYVGDMTALNLPRRYDVITCLFSAIGYVESETALRHAIAGMRRHLNRGGVLIVDPWFEPGQLTHGWITVLLGTGADVTVCRMSRTLVEGTTSRLEFEYPDWSVIWNRAPPRNAHAYALYAIPDGGRICVGRSHRHSATGCPANARTVPGIIGRTALFMAGPRCLWLDPLRLDRVLGSP